MVKRKKSSKTPRKIHKVESFKLYAEPTPFMTFRVTEQTFYWFVMIACIFCLALWVLSIQLDTNRILDSIVATI